MLMEMFLAAVLCYSIGVLTVFAPHHMQMMAHYVANLAAVVGSGLVFFTNRKEKAVSFLLMPF